MLKQSGKSAALYYRTATGQEPGQHLDNQMQKLLCCAKNRGYHSFIIYADIGASGLTQDHPAMNALKTDIKAGRVETVIVVDISRIGRDILMVDDFIKTALTYGTEVTDTEGDTLACAIPQDAIAYFCDLLKGGERT